SSPRSAKPARAAQSRRRHSHSHGLDERKQTRILPRMIRLVLASTSRHRADVLRRLGVPFDTANPEVEEVIAPGATPFSAATTLARKKALAISVKPAFKDALVIGSDQVCVAPDGAILGKPG